MAAALGPLLEYLWRANLRALGPVGYTHAESLFDFGDKAVPGTRDVRHAALRALEEMRWAVAPVEHFGARTCAACSTSEYACTGSIVAASNQQP